MIKDPGLTEGRQPLSLAANDAPALRSAGEFRAVKGGLRQKRVSNPNPITVDGIEMVWEKRHPVFLDWRKELKGISVSVWVKPGKTKELIMDVLFDLYGIDRMPNPDRWNQVLAQAIRSAMAAGWDPDSRGASFRHTPSVSAPEL